ncbi:hypothetical protein QFZ79_000555 [Arthrobacter sp. V4I6]|uniref:DUF4232 domain-containing protein n=1 Tax=unclassified Arthrobacter TaxID=235627 RepID=UPI0027880E48|nr:MULTISPECIES: DUF4232 domain-containing protein [unclassified Arthrobacter]MDQ0822815.1 hypothetical protein [Arthrobacter sp. V1I7]MDQ0852444.1 hypothetical protein [Arthrobacter sp. V4I6]
MTAQRIKNGLALTSVAAAAVLLLNGCGSSPAPAASEPASPTASSPSTQGTAAAATGGTQTPEPSAASPLPAPQAGPAMCKSANLTAATDSTGGGAAGSVYLQLVLTNSGAEPCLLKGYPGVSLTADANGDPIGAAATRDGSTPVTDILLAPGKAGTATLRYTQASNYPDCTRTPAAGFRIYPPEDTASLFVASPRDACSNTGVGLLTIGAFQAK